MRLPSRRSSWQHELGLPEPAQALGMRGTARASLGDPQGLEDMRRALALALERGQGRAAAVLHNNLALNSWQYEGPPTALDACREGIDFCRRRGITEFALAIASMSTTFLAELGRAEQALVEAASVADRLEAAGDVNSVEPRALQLRLLAERGAHEHAPGAEALIAKTRESGEPQDYATAFTAAARLLLAQGHRERANALLDELAQVPDIHASPYYAAALPDLVRTALALRRPDVANLLVDGIEPHTPFAEHALCTVRAQLAEAAEQHIEAAAQYAEAAEHWRKFGNVPEHAYALLGRARCLNATGDMSATRLLLEARELFASMGFAPAVAEVDAYLGPAEAGVL